MNTTDTQTDILFVDGGVCAPLGFKAGGIHCGIRRNKTKRDLSLIVADVPCAAAAVYTQNLVYGAPITVTKRSLADGYARAAICNSGIANTCNPDGLEKAEAMRRLTADALGFGEDDIIVASTGVIGQPLDLTPIRQGLPALVADLSADGSDAAAQGIMTTDTRKKEFAAEFTVGGKTCRVGAIAKGSGMICPNMATMLCFITTDIAVSPAMLQAALEHAVGVSFNMLSVDGDTSTNDMACVLASGLAGNAPVTDKGDAYDAFAAALTAVCVRTAREMARDGEGATKLLECTVRGAADAPTAKALAKSVINSALVKTAMFGADANWGRILCAMGYAGVPFTVESTRISFVSAAGTLLVCNNGAAVEFSETVASAILTEPEIIIAVELCDGTAEATAYGCDFSYDYVKINGDYRT